MTSIGATTPLVGREPVLIALRSAVAAASAGRGSLVLVTGEPGIGKTALLAELSGQAAGTGALVLWAQCWSGDGAPAFWPWVQVLRAGIAAGGDAGDAVMVLPERASAARSSASDSAEARFRLFDAVVSFLTDLAAARPVVVVLDDLHWADEDSLQLIEFASHHLAASAVLLLGSYRDEEAGDRLRQLGGMSERLALPGLPRDEIATLMASLTGDEPPASVAADVWRRTGGNPFLARELTRLIVAEGDYSRRAAYSPQLLDSVRDILERRLARLSQPCVELLTVVAVFGPEVRREALVRAVGTAGDPTAALPGLLDEAVAARVLLPPAAALGGYRFSHDLFRETILVGLPADRRTDLHLSAGRVLEELQREGVPVHPAELASHFGAAAAPADAVHYGRLAAADAGSRLAFDEARGHCERVVTMLETGKDADPSLRLDALLALADARNRAGDGGQAHAAYREAADLARLLDDATSLAKVAIGVHALGWRTIHREAISLLEEAVRMLPDEPSELRARVLAALARDLHHSFDGAQDWDRTPGLAEQAVATARQLDDPSALAFCLLALHDARWRPGTASVRLPVIDDMLAAASAAGDRDMEAQATLLRATALIELGTTAGTAELEKFCARSEELGHARARHGALTRRATLALLSGDDTRAVELAEEAFALGSRIGEPDSRGLRETVLWGVSWLTGDWQRFGGAADAGVLDSEPWPGLPLLAAITQLAEGDDAAAASALDRLDLDGLPRAYDLEMMTFIAQASVAVGSAERRGRVYDMLLPYAGFHVVVGGCAAYYGAVDHLLGLLARSLGRTEQARAHFAAAATQHDKLGATAWAKLSRQHGEACRDEVTEQTCVFRRDGDVWTVRYRDTESHLPDVKGLHDLAVLLGNPGHAVHAVELHSGHPPQDGADAVLDDTAKAAYRKRLTELATRVDEAEEDNDIYRAEQARTERDALIAELSAAAGLGGRDRRLGDDRERARKAVTARIRDAIGRIERGDPALGEHLRATVRTGTWCCYTPDEPVRWRR